MSTVFLALSKVTVLLMAPPGLALLVRMLCQSPQGILSWSPSRAKWCFCGGRLFHVAIWGLRLLESWNFMEKAKLA